ncbi:MAG: hypothetical protein ACK4WF_02080 [Candidatus Brocadiales bacterium]
MAASDKDVLNLRHPSHSGIASSDTDLYLEMARAGIEAKRYKQVAKLCERILQKDEANKEANFLQGIAYHYLGEHDLAVERLRWVLLLDKDNVVAEEYLERSERKSTSQWGHREVSLINSAKRYYEEGLNGLAIGTLKEILKQNPQNTEAWELLGDIYEEFGNLTIAKALYHKADAKEKAKEIRGEVKYVPKEWWEGLTKKEAKLYEANLRFMEVVNQAVRMGGKLSEFNARAEDKLILEAKRLDEKAELVRVWQEKLQGVTKTEQQQVSPGMLTPEAKLTQRPLLDYEIKESGEKNLQSLQDKYNEERSQMVKELEDKTKEFAEAESHMESLEEELGHASLGK